MPCRYPTLLLGLRSTKYLGEYVATNVVNGKSKLPGIEASYIYDKIVVVSDKARKNLEMRNTCGVRSTSL